jgi:hypothetical protein
VREFTGCFDHLTTAAVQVLPRVERSELVQHIRSSLADLEAELQLLENNWGPALENGADQGISNCGDVDKTPILVALLRSWSRDPYRPRE